MTQVDERMSIREMMERSELGSPSPLHVRLKSMRAKS